MSVKYARAAIAALATLASVAAFTGAAYADGPAQGMSRSEQKAATGVTQTKSIGEGVARVDLTSGYVFIAAPDVPPILKTLKAPSPRGGDVQGAVAPAGKSAGAGNYWISVISYSASGNTPETGSDEIAAINFFDSVKAARPADPLESFGAAPAYDPVVKNLAWTENYTAKSGRNSLRNEQRALGRAGVIGLTTIGRPTAADKIAAEARAVRAMVSFNDGQRYSDFIQSTDRVSDCNLPCLIDGKPRAVVAAPPPEQAPSAGFTAADLLPGGKYGWASYLAGGLAVLGLGYGVTRAMQSNKADDNVTPPTTTA
jgi:uncharacterized membrane-anchored protein